MAIETGVGVGVAVLALVFAYLGLNLEERHSPLKWLFILFSVATGVVDVFLLGKLAKSAGETAVGNILNQGFFYGTIIVLIFTILYFLLFFLSKTVAKMGNETYAERNR